MKISIGGDHCGFPLKGPIIEMLKKWGHEVTDHGAFDTNPVDFPDVAHAVCGQVRRGEADRGIMVCGTGVGASIAANKIPGIRAALCHDVHCAHQCVEHDDTNVLCIGAWIIGIKTAEEVVRHFLDARFDPDPDFVRRVAKLAEMEKQAAREILGIKD